MSDHITELEDNQKLRRELKTLRTLCETEVLPVLDYIGNRLCEFLKSPGGLIISTPCGQCDPCRAAKAAESLRKELKHD